MENRCFGHFFMSYRCSFVEPILDCVSALMYGLMHGRDQSTSQSYSNTKLCFSYSTTALISHANKILLRIIMKRIEKDVRI